MSVFAEPTIANDQQYATTDDHKYAQFEEASQHAAPDDDHHRNDGENAPALRNRDDPGCRICIPPTRIVYHQVAMNGVVVIDQKEDERPKDGSKRRKEYVKCDDVRCCVCKPELTGFGPALCGWIKGGRKRRVVYRDER